MIFRWIIKQVFVEEMVSRDWRRGIVVPIFKDTAVDLTDLPSLLYQARFMPPFYVIGCRVIMNFHLNRKLARLRAGEGFRDQIFVLNK